MKWLMHPGLLNQPDDPLRIPASYYTTLRKDYYAPDGLLCTRCPTTRPNNLPRTQTADYAPRRPTTHLASYHMPQRRPIAHPDGLIGTPAAYYAPQHLNLQRR